MPLIRVLSQQRTYVLCLKRRDGRHRLVDERPWRYIVATKDDPDEFQRLLSCLVELNQIWAKAETVLALGVASLSSPTPRTGGWLVKLLLGGRFVASATDNRARGP
jgi:hypothetical protein